MFDLDECTAFITNKASKQLTESFNNRLMILGVTRVQWIALFYLGKYEGVSQKKLGELMGVKESSVARLIDRLEKKDYVIREKELTDRRITNLKLTKEGKKARENLMPEGEKFSEILTKNITDEQLEIFNYVLKTMVKNAI